MNYELIDTISARINYYSKQIADIINLQVESASFNHKIVIYSMCIERLAQRLKKALNETHD